MNTNQTTTAQIPNKQNHLVHLVDPVQSLPSDLSDLNPEDIATMDLHQLGDLITSLEREISQPTENQESPSEKIAENQREIPENSENSRPFSASTPPSATSHTSHPSADRPSPPAPSSPTPLNVRHSILLALNQEDRAFVLDLLETHTLEQTKARLAQPRPFGLNIRVSISGLWRFGSNARVDEIVAHQDSALDEAAVILENAGEMDDTQFVLAAKHLLKLRLVRTAISRQSSTAELRALFQTLDRLRQTDLAERRLQLAEKRAANAEIPAARTNK